MLRLDPRTKLALLFTVTTLMLGASNEGAMLAVKMLLSLVPFVLILSAGRWQMASKYLLYLCALFFGGAHRLFFAAWVVGLCGAGADIDHDALCAGHHGRGLLCHDDVGE